LASRSTHPWGKPLALTLLSRWAMTGCRGQTGDGAGGDQAQDLAGKAGGERSYRDHHRDQGDHRRELSRGQTAEEEQPRCPQQDRSRPAAPADPHQGDGQVEGHEVARGDRGGERRRAPVDPQPVRIAERRVVLGQKSRHAEKLERLEDGDGGDDPGGAHRDPQAEPQLGVGAHAGPNDEKDPVVLPDGERIENVIRGDGLAAQGHPQQGEHRTRQPHEQQGTVEASQVPPEAGAAPEPDRAAGNERRPQQRQQCFIRAQQGHQRGPIYADDQGRGGEQHVRGYRGMGHHREKEARPEQGQHGQRRLGHHHDGQHHGGRRDQERTYAEATNGRLQSPESIPVDSATAPEARIR